MTRKKKVKSPEDLAAIAAGEAKAQEIVDVIKRSIEGGLTEDVKFGTRMDRYGARLLRGERAREFTRRLRGVVEGMGARLYLNARRTLQNGLMVFYDVPPLGCFVASPPYWSLEFLEG